MKIRPEILGELLKHMTLQEFSNADRRYQKYILKVMEDKLNYKKT